MLLAWMLYATAIGMLVAGAAIALDRLASIWTLPRRVIWIAAAVVAVTLPVSLAARRPEPPEMITFELPLAPAGPSQMKRVQTTRMELAGPSPRAFEWHLKYDWDPQARVIWGLGTLALILVAARGVWVTLERRRRWAETEIDGYPVLVTEDSGPAVVGALDPEIVVPRWALELGPREREMMLTHENEHIEARDPLVLAITGVLLMLFPWNAPLWFIVRQLRLAIEIDCDARVLRRLGKPREYGMLLIAVSARHGTSLPMAASLVERRLLIERRILAMTTLRPSRPLLASLPFAAIIGFAALAVAQTPKPTAPPKLISSAPSRSKTALREAPQAMRVEKGGTAVPLVERPAVAKPVVVTPEVESRVLLPTRSCCEISEDTLAVWMARYHADVVTGATNAETVIFVVDNDGRYVTSRVRVRSDEATAKMQKEREAITARMSMDANKAVIVSGDRIALTEAAVAADREVVDRRAQEMQEMKVALATRADDAARLKEKLALMQSDDPNFVEKMKAREELVRIRPAMENDALQGLEIPADAIQAVNVLKKPEGRMAPGPIGIITVFLKKS